MNAGVPRNRAIAANADGKYYDLGLYGPARTDFPGRKEYCGFFRAPTLRNTALRDAYFHNGVFHSLREVVQFYVDRDIHPEKWYPRNGDGSVHQFDDLPPECPNNVDKDPPLDRGQGDQPALTDAEIDDLVAFLRTLTDGYAAGAAPVAVPTSATDDEHAWRAFAAVNRRATRSGDDPPCHVGGLEERQGYLSARWKGSWSLGRARCKGEWLVPRAGDAPLRHGFIRRRRPNKTHRRWCHGGFRPYSHCHASQ